MIKYEKFIIELTFKCTIFDIEITQVENLSRVINILVDLFIYLWIHLFILVFTLTIFWLNTECFYWLEPRIGFNALMHRNELVSFIIRNSTMSLSHFNVKGIQALLLNFFIIILLNLNFLILSLTLRSIYLWFLNVGQARLFI